MHFPMFDRWRALGCAAVLTMLWLAGGCASRTGVPAKESAPVASADYIYVSPKGNDQWSGLLPAPNAQRTDGPVATLPRALELARQYKAGQPGAKVTIGLATGLYRLDQPLALKPEDSGLEICSQRGAWPVVSGGRVISGWKPVTRDGKSLWAVELPEVREGKWYFRQLWSNGERLTRARHPNRGYFEVAQVPDAKAEVPWSEGQARFQFKGDDLKAWPTIANAEVCVMNRWVESHLPVVKIDEAGRVASFGKKSVFKLEPGDRYYLENTFETLDQPGEWYLERATGLLYYWPRPGADLARFEVVAPVLPQLVRLEGARERPVVKVIFRGVTFAHTEWYFPGGFDSGPNKIEVWPPPKAEIGGFAQAAVGVSGAVWGEFVRQATFENCTFRNLGGYALELAKGCQRVVVTRCELGDLGAGGVKLGETALRDHPDEFTRDNEISDCHIHDGGQVFHSAIGIWLGQTPANKIVHNHIHDFYYTGISIGWTWGYGRALATNNLVEFNHVHHIGVKANGDGPILSDMAGIYTLGLNTGTMIRNNVWHDSAGLRYGGWGIYFDEGTTGILAENNLVYRTTHGGFHQHYGRDNTVRNNIFAYARDHQIQRSRAEGHLSFTFENNVVLFKTGKLLDGNYSGGVTNFLFRSNLYWQEGGGELKFGPWTFADWQQRGQDAGSLIADPLFENPAEGNFKLRPGSPALNTGFKPFDVSTVGPRR